jgi:hypothetical protein
MEHGTGQPKPPTVDDHWPLDHHIEEILDCLNHAARTRDSGPDAYERRLEIAVGELWACR